MRTLSIGTYKEKGSKFIAMAIACFSENEARNHLDAWRKEHPQARHLCYAYRFGADKQVYRANDDGEPNHSAGTPILGQIQSHDLSNILIGVVRYFGGTKLGVGGLVNAYKTAAQEAIMSGEVAEFELQEHVLVVCPYETMPYLMKLIKKHGLKCSDQEVAMNCSMRLSLPLSQKDFLLHCLEKIEKLEITNLGTY
jgi:uncharacterized YigZ family protein